MAQTITTTCDECGRDPEKRDASLIVSFKPGRTSTNQRPALHFCDEWCASQWFGKRQPQPPRRPV